MLSKQTSVLERFRVPHRTEGEAEETALEKYKRILEWFGD
jgi:hypothetical protein